MTRSKKEGKERVKEKRKESKKLRKKEGKERVKEKRKEINKVRN